MQPPKRILTISVDDGYPLDFKAAEMLSALGLRATFYIPARNPERELMNDSQIRELASAFDIGGHTWSHLSLHRMDDARALQEIVDGKRWIEDVIGRPVKAFCYPQGKFNRRTPAMARQAGFVCGRTCMLNRVEFPADRFLWGVSTHAANYRPMIQVRHALLEGNLSGARNFLTVHRAAGDWTVHFRHALRHVQRHGGIAHLYLHTWEIDRNGDWGRLKAAFQEAADSGLTRLDNAQVFEP